MTVKPQTYFTAPILAAHGTLKLGLFPHKWEEKCAASSQILKCELEVRPSTHNGKVLQQ